jgi:uncharacterized membrane protein
MFKIRARVKVSISLSFEKTVFIGSFYVTAIVNNKDETYCNQVTQAIFKHLGYPANLILECKGWHVIGEVIEHAKILDIAHYHSDTI